MIAGIMAVFLISYPTAGVTFAVGDYLTPPTIEVKQEEIVEAAEPEFELPDWNFDLFARVIECEAGNQGTLGKRLVCDVILNRIDNERFPNTLEGVIYQKNQFECLIRSWFWSRPVPKENYEIIEKELQERTHDDILFFRTDHYHEFGTPMFKYKDHYFSRW